MDLDRRRIVINKCDHLPELIENKCCFAMSQGLINHMCIVMCYRLHGYVAPHYRSSVWCSGVFTSITIISKVIWNSNIIINITPLNVLLQK